MEGKLKKYDKLLIFKKHLNGSIDIIRKSPFDTQKEHLLFSIKNMATGSSSWVIRKLMLMDTTRRDIVGEALRHNWAIRDKKENRNIHNALADFMHTNGSIIINK